MNSHTLEKIIVTFLAGIMVLTLLSALFVPNIGTTAYVAPYHGQYAAYIYTNTAFDIRVTNPESLEQATRDANTLNQIKWAGRVNTQ